MRMSADTFAPTASVVGDATTTRKIRGIAAATAPKSPHLLPMPLAQKSPIVTKSSVPEVAGEQKSAVSLSGLTKECNCTAGKATRPKENTKDIVETPMAAKGNENPSIPSISPSVASVAADSVASVASVPPWLVLDANGNPAWLARWAEDRTGPPTSMKANFYNSTTGKFEYKTRYFNYAAWGLTEPKEEPEDA